MGDNEVGKFFAIEMDIVSGTLLHGYYEMDSDGENCTDYVDYPSNSLILSPVTSDDTFKFSWYDSLEEEPVTIIEIATLDTMIGMLRKEIESRFSLYKSMMNIT